MTDSTWYLGQTSEKYEVGSAGAGQISHAQGDHGGTSYGIPQFSVKTGSLAEYLRDSSYGKKFAGLTPDTPAFDAKWKEIARTDPNFGRDQHAYASKAMYEVQVERLKHAGLDLTQRGPAVQDALWSTSIQCENLTKGIFEHALAGKYGKDYQLSKLSDKEIVTAVQDYKHDHTEKLFSSSPELWKSLRQRALDEKADLIRLADGKSIDPSHRESSNVPHRAEPREHSLNEGSHGPAAHALQADLARLGYTDHHGKLLAADGTFGIDTRHAVERFQHDHHLTVDGKVGPLTQHALHTAVQQQARAHELNDPKNPGHALFEQALAGVRRLDERGHPTEQQQRNLAAALVIEAKREGFTRIDQVTLSNDSRRALIVQQPTSMLEMTKFGSVDTVTALQTPEAQGAAAAATLPSPSVAPSAPIIHAPAATQAQAR